MENVATFTVNIQTFRISWNRTVSQILYSRITIHYGKPTHFMCTRFGFDVSSELQHCNFHMPISRMYLVHTICFVQGTVDAGECKCDECSHVGEFANQ